MKKQSNDKKRGEIVDHTVILERVMERVMHESMMPYSEHVILDRAVPRVEDGLKPVQRRVLYAMYELGLTPDKAFRKSANIVGETMAKYHPHGDSSIYDTMVRLAQGFNMRVPLVEGSGNFGSMDGDPAAAFRYTEARLASAALPLMSYLGKDTVSTSLNFDDTRREPDLLPALFPNLLVNGSAGIAVGLATSIPPHNPSEVIDGVIAYLENPRLTLDELMQHIKGPDFPTGGILTNASELQGIYERGEGKLQLRARASVERQPDGKDAIVITEFPYQTNKAELLQRILEHAQAKKEIGAQISDIRDESDRTGVRSVIELRRGCDGEKLLRYLYRYTDLQRTVSVSMIAIAEGRPVRLSLLDAVRYYVASRRTVERRRAEYDLQKAREREQVLAGLSVAAASIETVIKIIRSSRTPAIARERLCEQLSLSEVQANAILEMRLRRITGLEIETIESELAELRRLIVELEALLSDKRRMTSYIRRSLTEIKKTIGDARRTDLTDADCEGVSLDAFKTVEDTVVYLDEAGDLHRVSPKIFENLQKGESPIPRERYAEVRTDGALMLFDQLGGVYRLDVDAVPECRSARDKGAFPAKLIGGFAEQGSAVFLCSADGGGGQRSLLFVTAAGMVKCSPFSDYEINRKKFEAILLRQGDTVVYAGIRVGESPITLLLSDGKKRVRRDPVSLTGRRTYGVRAVKPDAGVFVERAMQGK